MLCSAGTCRQKFAPISARRAGLSHHLRQFHDSHIDSFSGGLAPAVLFANQAGGSSPLNGTEKLAALWLLVPESARDVLRKLWIIRGHFRVKCSSRLHEHRGVPALIGA